MSAFDFLDIVTVTTKDGLVIEPEFNTKRTKDLLIRGGDFYAIWNEEAGLWSTDRYTAVELIDKEIATVVKKCKETGANVRGLYLRNGKNKKIDEFNKYCKDRMWENCKGRGLDEKLVFSNSPVKKEDYASMRLPYPLEKGPTDNWDRLVSTLYSPEERMKIEWTIGCIISGDSKRVQKCVILYGDKGTGKSTIINVIQDLLTVSYNEDGKPYERYFSTFDAKSLGSSNRNFALESFRNNPLVSIQHESNLSKLDDNTRLNSLISHEEMLMEVKNKSSYSKNFNTFLIMATNNPVKITDAKSGLLRRIIDISPTGEKIKPVSEYNKVVEGIKFEKSGIAWKCLDIYKHNKHLYDDYVPINMLNATNDLYNFLYCSDEYDILRRDGSTVLKEIWPRYKLWCEGASIKYPMQQTPFREELKSYFKEFKDRDTLDDGTRVRSRYLGFKYDAFNKSQPQSVKPVHSDIPDWLQLSEQTSKLDILLKDCPAQYATDDEKPKKAWDNVSTVLGDISTSKLHYVRPPVSHIVIDLDIHGEDGLKSLIECIKTVLALGLPMTYAETSKSGNGLHLHYIYTGDVEQLSRLIVPNVEIKIFTGKMSLRRKLTLCNNLDISTISSGLPLKEKKKVMIDFDSFKSVEALEKEIIANMQKKRVNSTVQSMSLIQADLEKAYNSDLSYDLSRMYGVLMNFAMSSHNSRDRAVDICHSLKLRSKDYEEHSEPLIGIPHEKVDLNDIHMFDWEVFENYSCVAYETEPWKVTCIINPTSADIERLVKLKLGGFNCKSYDNNITYAAMMGYDNKMKYKLSSNLVSNDKKRQKDSQFRDAKNLSFIDIFEMCTTKQSLKKWEIELKRKRVKDKETGKIVYPYKMLEHIEANVDWDKPLPENMFKAVAEYCMNDVLATRAVAEANKSDYKAREMMADISGLPMNEGTNAHSTKFIFGNDRNPQSQFNYYFMGVPKNEISLDKYTVPALECDWEYTVFDKQGRAFFPDYEFIFDKERGKYISTYRGEEVGEGGYVYAEPGIYHNVVTFDVASMHPSSIEALNLFGDIYTKRFSEIKQARIYIKHKEYDKAKALLGGALAKYLDDPDEAKALSRALKIVINSVYGLTAAKFPNPFKDEKNIDNIVAKRGALFMVNLKHEVQRRGFTVVHIKTDSIKVENPSPEIAQFISDYGKLYGYTFEVEAEYERMCLINDAVYIAKLKEPEIDEVTDEEIWWTATGTRFQVPYVYKTLFSHQPIEFWDMCEVFSVQTKMYLDMNEALPDVSDLEKEYKKTGNENLLLDIQKGHNYEFVGRVGEFTPVTAGGGILLRKSDTGYSSVGGTKGYRWLESDKAKVLIEKGDTQIDISYYNNLINDAIAEISKFGDFEAFVS